MPIPAHIPGFNPSVTLPLPFKPWRWTSQPVYGNGPLNPPTVAGVKQELGGKFILLDDEIFEFIKNKLTAAEKTELASWVNRMDVNHVDPLKRPQTWNVPLWSGQDKGIYIRIPATEMNNPSSPVSARVIRFFDKFYSNDTPS